MFGQLQEKHGLFIKGSVKKIPGFIPPTERQRLKSEKIPPPSVRRFGLKSGDYDAEVLPSLLILTGRTRIRDRRHLFQRAGQQRPAASSRTRTRQKNLQTTEESGNFNGNPGDEQRQHRNHDATTSSYALQNKTRVSV